MIELEEKDIELTLEQKKKVANTIKGMKKSGVPEEVIQQSFLDMDKHFKQQNGKEIIANTMFRKSVMLPEVTVKGGDGTLNEGDLKQDKEFVTKKGNKYLRGIGLEVTPNIGKSVEFRNTETEEATDIKTGGKIKEYLNPDYNKNAINFIQEKINDRFKELENDPEQNFDSELYNESHQYVWKNFPTVKHSEENRYLTEDELNTDQLKEYRSNTWRELMDNWMSSPSGQLVLKEIEPFIVEKVNKDYAPKIAQQLIDGEIDENDAWLKINMAYANVLDTVLQDNKEYQTVYNTNALVIASNFDFDLNEKLDDDFASTFYPSYLQGDLDFFQGIYDNYKVYGPQAANLNALDINSKKHRNILHNLSIIDDYSIGSDDLMKGGAYISTKMQGQKLNENKTGKIYHPGVRSFWNPDGAEDELGNVYAPLNFPSGYYEKEDLKQKLIELEKAYRFEMTTRMAKENEFKKTIQSLGNTSFINERWKFTMTLDQWQKELGRQTFNTFAGMFTGSLYSIGIERAGAFSELLDGEAKSRVGEKWDNMSEDERNNLRLRILDDGLTEEMVYTMIHGSGEDFVNMDGEPINISETPEISRFTAENPADRISSKARGVGIINGILETSSDGWILLRGAKAVTKLIPTRLWAQLMAKQYKQIIKAGKNLGKEMLLSGFVIEPITENLQEVTKEVALFTEGNPWGYTLNEAANLTFTTMSTATFMPLGGSVVNTLVNQYQYSTTDSELQKDIQAAENKMLEDLAKDPNNKQLQEEYEKMIEVNQKLSLLVTESGYDNLTAWIEDTDSKYDIITNILGQVDLQTEIESLNERIKELKDAPKDALSGIVYDPNKQKIADLEAKVKKKQAELQELANEIQYTQIMQEYLKDFRAEAIAANQDPNSIYSFKSFDTNEDMINYLINRGLDPNSEQGRNYIQAIEEGRNFGSFSELTDENGKFIMAISEENAMAYIKDNVNAGAFIAGNVIFHEKMHANLKNLVVNETKRLMEENPSLSEQKATKRAERKIQEISYNLQTTLSENLAGVHQFALNQILVDPNFTKGIDYRVNSKGEFTYLNARAAEEYIAKISDGFAGLTLQDMSTTEGLKALEDFKIIFNEITQGKDVDFFTFLKNYNKNDLSGPRTEADMWVDDNGMPANFFYNDINIQGNLEEKAKINESSIIQEYKIVRDTQYGTESNTLLVKTKEAMEDLVQRYDDVNFVKGKLNEITFLNIGTVGDVLSTSGFRQELSYILDREEFELQVLKEYATFMPRWDEAKGVWKGYKPVLTEEEFNNLEDPDFKRKVGGDGKFAEYYYNPVSFNAYIRGPLTLQNRISGIYDKAIKAYEAKLKAEEENTDNGGNDIFNVLDNEEAIRNNQQISKLRQSLKIKGGTDLYTDITVKAASIAKENADLLENPAKFQAAIKKQYKKDWKELRDQFFPGVKRVTPSYNTENYINYVKTNLELIYNTMSIADLTRLGGDQFTRVVVLDETGRTRMNVEESKNFKGGQISDKKAGNELREKLPFDEAAFEEFLLKTEQQQNLRDAGNDQASINTILRLDMLQESVLKNLNNLLMQDAILTGFQTAEYIAKYGPAKSMIGQVAQVLQKNIDFKFSTIEGNVAKIHHSTINFEQRANTIVRSIESKNFGSDNLQGVIDHLKTIKEDPIVKSFVLRLYDRGFIETADKRKFKEKVIAMGDESFNKLITYNSDNRALRYNIKNLANLNKMAGLIVDRIGPLFGEIGYDILGYHLRFLDPAFEKMETIIKVDDNGDVIVNKDGSLKKERVPILGEQGAFYEEKAKLIDKVLSDTRELDINIEDIRLMTPTSPLWRKINEITSDGSLTREDKIERIKGLNEEIQAANTANIQAVKLVANTVYDLYDEGKISKLDVYNFYQMQTTIEKGFRGYSILEYITVTDGAFTINKNEHININGNTMFDAYKGTIEKNRDAVNAAFDEHVTWATDGISSNPMDYNPFTGKKDLLTMEGGYKRFINTPNSTRKNVITPNGEPLSEVMTKKALEEDIKENRIDIKLFESGISVLDFDDTLATTNSLIRYTTPDGTTGTLNAEQYAKNYVELADKGYVFDFSEFNEVVEGKIAPLFNKALKLQGKFGTKNMFVLTARPAEAAPAIHAFLKAHGLHIPLENITGLANSTPEAKALWIANKVGEGYNDFYFADDSEANVQAVENILDQMGVKRKTTVADPKFVIKQSTLSLDFNIILEETEGMDRNKQFSDAQGQMRGQAKDKYRILAIMPSAQDFKGLLYSFLAKGKKGEEQMEFFEKNLIRPYVKGMNDINTARQELNKNYKSLIKRLPKVKVKLTKLVPGTNYSYGQAVRVYLWDKNGMEIPGLSKRDQKTLVKAVNDDASLITFSKGLSDIVQQENGYLEPSEYWITESIASDLYSLTGRVGRSKFLEEFVQNREAIFGELTINGKLKGPNAAKIEAIYGSKFLEALGDILYRMEFGRNRSLGGDRITSNWDNWVNGSVGTIMFFNMRSAVLQLISATNYIDMANNNPLKAAAAFANQPNYWKTVAKLWNSPFLQQRLSGEARTINEAELSAFVQGKEDKFSAALSYLLKIGFTPTRLADATAITMGGATYFINQKKAYIKDGLSEQEAETRAMEDWIAKSQEAQQSSDAMFISQQQAGNMGRIILAFKNTPMQYARLIDKAVRDIYAGRGDTKSNLAKIAYYGAIQNYIFNYLQQALWKAEADGEEFDEKTERMINGMLDSLLNGIGLGGNVVASFKNGVLKYRHEEKKGWNADHTYTILQLANVSPTIGSKLRKIYGSIQSERFNKEVIKEMPFWNLGNPAFDVMANLVSGLTNIPLDRAVNKIQNLIVAADSETEFWDSFALTLGWNVWDLGLETEARKVRKELKEKKKAAKKRCTAIKSNGEQCKNKTTNKSGKCYAHDK